MGKTHLRAGLGVQSVGSGCKKPKEKCTFEPVSGCISKVQGAKILRKNAPSSRLRGAVCSAEVLFSYHLNPLQKITYIPHRIRREEAEKVALGAGKGIQEAIA